MQMVRCILGICVQVMDGHAVAGAESASDDDVDCYLRPVIPVFHLRMQLVSYANRPLRSLKEVPVHCI